MRILGRKKGIDLKIKLYKKLIKTVSLISHLSRGHG